MRELTKSIISFSWAVSLLGIKEATRLFQPGQVQGPYSNSCEPVTQAAVAQLDPSVQGVFRTGDNFQRGVVNAVFGVFNPGNWNFLRPRPGAVDPTNRNPVGSRQVDPLR